MARVAEHRAEVDGLKQQLSSAMPLRKAISTAFGEQEIREALPEPVCNCSGERVVILRTTTWTGDLFVCPECKACVVDLLSPVFSPLLVEPGEPLRWADSELESKLGDARYIVTNV
jgi:hypothetical protein